MEPALQPDMDAVAALPHRSRKNCWRRSHRASTTSRRPTGPQVTNLGMMRAVPEVKDTVNLAQQYVNLAMTRRR